MCNGEFFKNSYPIHRKKCEKKYVLVNSACEYCGRMVPNCDLNAHIGPCKKRNAGKTLAARQAVQERKRQKLMEKQAKQQAAALAATGGDDVEDEIAAMERKLAALKAAKTGAKKSKLLTKKPAVPPQPFIPPNPNDPANQMSSDGRIGKKINLEAEIEKAAANGVGHEDDGRIACSCCGRGFNPDRIVAHEDICLRIKENRAKRKKKLKVKTGEDLRLKDTEFAKFRNKRAPDPPKKSRWREDAQALMNIVQAGRNVVRFQRAGVPLSELPPSGEEIGSGYEMGDPVMTNDGRRGLVKWVGEIADLPGDDQGQIRTFIGVEFNNAVGQHDGTLKASGERIFHGKSGHCSFFLPPKLLRVKSSAGADMKTNFSRKKHGFQSRKPQAKQTHKEKKLTAKFEDLPKAKYNVFKKTPAQRKPSTPPKEESHARRPAAKKRVTADSRPKVDSAAARAAAARFETKGTKNAAGSGVAAVRGSHSASEQIRSRSGITGQPRQAGGMVRAKMPKKFRTKIKNGSGSSKENSRPAHMEAWGGGSSVAERKKPYGDQTLSNASLKYRASKSKGRPDASASSAVYKARMRLKKAGNSHKTPMGVSKAQNAAAARAKAKPAFGSAAKSVADDLNEHVFGKEKKGKKEYLSNGKFRYKTEPRERKQISKARNKPAVPTRGNKLGANAPAAPKRASPRASPRTNNVEMGKGQSLGGTGRGRAAAGVDNVRAKRLAFLARLEGK